MKPPSEFPPFLRELIDNPPQAGNGIHHWLFKAARQLHAHLPSCEIVSLLESRWPWHGGSAQIAG